MSIVTRSLTTILLASALSAGVALLPITPFGVHTAWPKGGGGGGGGDGGGHGSADKGGAGKSGGSVGSAGVSAASATTFDLGNHGKGSKGSKGSAASKGVKDPKGKGSTASALGALNAAHASANALAHASPNSRVGKVAAYKDAINSLNTTNANLAAAQSAFNANPTPANQMALNDAIAAQATAQAAAAQALANAANKSISTTSVVGVDNLLGVSLSAPTTAADLAAQAAALQTKP